METDNTQKFVIGVIMVGLIIVIGIFILAAMQTSFTTGTTSSTSVNNETIASVTTGTPNAAASLFGVSCSWSDCITEADTWTIKYTWCMQEFTNDTDAGDGSCEYFTNGTYISDALNEMSGGIDGSIVTYGNAVENTTADLYINYTLPTNVTNNSLWAVSDGNITGVPWYVNLTFPHDCWADAYVNQVLSLRVASTWDAATENSTAWYCWGITDWLLLRNISTPADDSAKVFEEWMNWNINSSTNGKGVILGMNWSTSGCYVNSLTTLYNNTNWKCTYSYTTGVQSSAANASGTLITALSTGSAWITIIIVVGFAVIVLAFLSEGLGKMSSGREGPTY